MLLVTLVWRNARRDRWTWAGAWLGVGMSVKPFLLIFIPYLLLKRHWRGVAAAGLTAGCCFLLGWWYLARQPPLMATEAGTADSWAWLPMNASLFGIWAAASRQSRDSSLAELDPGAVRVIWLGPGHAGRPGGVIGLAHRPFENRIDRAFGLLLVSALLLSPLGWTYYFWLPLRPDCQRWQQDGGVIAPRRMAGGGRKSSLAPAVAPARDPGIVFTCISRPVRPALRPGDCCSMVGSRSGAFCWCGWR